MYVPGGRREGRSAPALLTPESSHVVLEAAPGFKCQHCHRQGGLCWTDSLKHKLDLGRREVCSTCPFNERERMLWQSFLADIKIDNLYGKGNHVFCLLVFLI